MRGRRIGRRSAFLLVHCFLLAGLFLQVTPFVVPLTAPAVEGAADGVGQYFEPLQVCDDLQSPGSLLADIPWIAYSPHTISSAAAGSSLSEVNRHIPREGFFSSLYRPPRPPSSLG